MPKRKMFEQMFLIITDHDNRVFNILGPIIDDTNPTNRVWELKRAGRNINCHVAEEYGNRESIIRDYTKQTGYQYVDSSII